MASSPSRAFSRTSRLVLIMTGFVVILMAGYCDYCNAKGLKNSLLKRGGLHGKRKQHGNGNGIALPNNKNKNKNGKKHKSPFKPGPWIKAHATFYNGASETFGGACGYEDVVKEGYGLHTVALSSALFNNGQTCGACYEIQCIDNPQWCKPGQPSLVVTATNLCPPNFNLPSNNGGWCNPPLVHFDIAHPVFCQIAEYKAGIIPIHYRRIACNKQGGIKFTITGNPYFNMVFVWNVGGAGDVVGMQVKGNAKLKWTTMTRNWGQKWHTNAMMVGESLTFRVRASDGRVSTSWHVAPKSWQFGRTYEGKNFK